MTSAGLRVEATRGDLVESVHRVTAAVVAADGRLLAASGDPDLVTWWRSAAKPFQALPLVEDGVADRFGLGDEDLALACASHSSEPCHLEAVDRFMARVGVTEADLACGPHPPLRPAGSPPAAGVPTPRWSNCSGKHTGMLALAKHHGWPLPQYHSAGHPVQDRMLEVVSEWSNLPRDQVRLGLDGCAAVCFALPVRAMALAYARFAGSSLAAPARIRRVMTQHPFLVAGTGRLCTDLMAAWPGKILAKIGAEGVYGAAIPELGWGVAVKVEDGDMRSVGPALLTVLIQALERLAPDVAARFPRAAVAAHARQVLRNTRDVPTGELRAAGTLRFLDT